MLAKNWRTNKNVNQQKSSAELVAKIAMGYKAIVLPKCWSYASC